MCLSVVISFDKLILSIHILLTAATLIESQYTFHFLVSKHNAGMKNLLLFLIPSLQAVRRIQRKELEIMQSLKAKLPRTAACQFLIALPTTAASLSGKNI